MRAVVTKQFQGRPDKAVVPRTIEIGEEIDGELAAVAIAQGWAEDLDAKPRRRGKGAKGAKPDSAVDLLGGAGGDDTLGADSAGDDDGEESE